MAFKIKNSDLNNETISIINQFIEMDINAVAAFRLSRIIKYISPILEDKLKAEKKIYDKWIIRDEFGNPVHPKDNNGVEMLDSFAISDMNAFTKEISDLMNVENEIPFDKLNFEDLDLKTAKIKDILKLDFLFN